MNRIITIFFLSVVLLSCNKNDTPKPDNSGLYVKFFGGTFDDNGFSAAPSNDGGFYLAGSTVQPNRPDTNILVIKIDRNGNKVWERKYTFGDIDHEVARDLLVDGHGDICIAGYKRSATDGHSDFLLMKVSKDNPDNVQSSLFGKPANDECALNLVQQVVNTDTSFILYGSVVSRDGSNSLTTDMYLLKTHFKDTIWVRQFGALSLNDQIGSIKVTKDQLLFCGTAFRTVDCNLRLVNSDSYGNLMWDYGFDANNSNNEYGYDMEIVPQGYILVGSKVRSGTTIKDIFVVRTDNDGIKTQDGNKNEFVIAGTGTQEAYSIKSIDNNTFVITGYTTTQKGDKDIYVAKVDINGNVIKSNTFGGDKNDVGNKILKTEDGGFLIVGTVEVANNTMMAVYKVNDKLELIP
jgi:hypothetical protein